MSGNRYDSIEELLAKQPELLYNQHSILFFENLVWLAKKCNEFRPVKIDCTVRCFICDSNYEQYAIHVETGCVICESCAWLFSELARKAEELRKAMTPTPNTPF